MIKNISYLVISLFLCASVSAQEVESVRWLTFEELEDTLLVNPKPVFIDFYTDWCTYCRKMDKVVFTRSEVIAMLNKEYYSVRFDAETETAVMFGGRKFVNDQIDKSRSPIHQIAQFLASREGRFSPPAIVILDEGFRVTARYFTYLDSKKLLSALD